jgi:hypothetical protein
MEQMNYRAKGAKKPRAKYSDKNELAGFGTHPLDYIWKSRPLKPPTTERPPLRSAGSVHP